MIFKITLKENDSKLWIFDSSFLKKYKGEKKQQNFCPLICYLLNSDYDILSESNIILIPRSKIYYPVEIIVFIYTANKYKDPSYFKFNYLDNEEIFSIKENKTEYNFHLRG